MTKKFIDKNVFLRHKEEFKQKHQAWMATGKKTQIL